MLDILYEETLYFTQGYYFWKMTIVLAKWGKSYTLKPGRCIQDDELDKRDGIFYQDYG